MTGPKSRKVKSVVVVTKAKKSRASTSKAKSKSAAGNPFGILGGLGGQYLGGPAGGALGMAAGNLISKITGFGAYKVSRNTVSNGNSVPTFRNGGDGMVVNHREFLTDINGSVNFKNQVFPINPGLLTSFPWLSLIAADFEEYETDGLVFEYRPTSGTAVSSTSSALGVVILATDYDVANPLFISKQQMESYEYSTSTVPFTACIHPVECARGSNVFNNLFVRTGVPPSGTDLRLYDVGNFQIATQGMQSAFVVGELWVSYSYRFRKPRIPGTPVRLGYARIRESPNGSSTGANPLGTVGLLTSDSGIALVPNPGGQSVIFPFPGTFLLESFWSQVGLTGLGFGFGANIVGGPTNFRDNSANSYQVLNASQIADGRYIQVLFPGVGTANTVTLLGVSVGTGTFDLVVTQVTTPLPLSALSPMMELEERMRAQSLVGSSVHDGYPPGELKVEQKATQATAHQIDLGRVLLSPGLRKRVVYFGSKKKDICTCEDEGCMNWHDADEYDLL
jgi:hypothetical protein